MSEPDPALVAAQLASSFEVGELRSEQMAEQGEEDVRNAGLLLEMVRAMPAGDCPPGLANLGPYLDLRLAEPLTLTALNLTGAGKIVELTVKLLGDANADPEAVETAGRTLSHTAESLEAHAKTLAAGAALVELRAELVARGWHPAT